MWPGRILVRHVSYRVGLPIALADSVQTTPAGSLEASMGVKRDITNEWGLRVGPLGRARSRREGAAGGLSEG